MHIYPGNINQIGETEDINLRWHKKRPRNYTNEHPNIILTQTAKKKEIFIFSYIL